ncbi:MULTISPECIES: tyrosine-protein phosphatase [Sphingobium]|uniref:Tyrosine-protein phosphatase n=1 Tax=Sphingobium fuliginis ATCC 27551 TaxID=1208342 RepID=A0A5B8CCH1_SPHSA|nr:MULTISPECIES: tyrosine-protein phosphatase [Sphingobium]OAP33666.1 protein tyrosine phosphatase [Sphingobium sp. 20006FA]AJR25434.1 protein tyrosine phosphatase [Sphingobium sp. YBL2]KXU33601.1 protein tyrosine phosphatase [Sphingobium sp. AM]KYC34056.1 protein tyrosine phosphatase [Sphingobium sp. 22B]QDC36989.1 tyrosine-protein phosphatase [Sphingobium fuliginis ATCC 27551]
MTIALSRLNFRDIGGLPTAGGGQVRSGILFRSEGPASFFEDHHAELSELGFRSVADLRSTIERDAAPHGWCGPDCRILDLDMNTDLRAQGEDMWLSLGREPTAARAIEVMSHNYGLMPQAFLPHLSRMVDALLAQDTPMLVHCTAGKDRTGVVVALFLDLLAVPRPVIMEDYRKSDIFGQNLRVSGHLKRDLQKTFGFVPPDDMVAILIGVQDDFLLSALDMVATRWGGIEGYFEAAGVDAERRTALRQLLATD